MLLVRNTVQSTQRKNLNCSLPDFLTISTCFYAADAPFLLGFCTELSPRTLFGLHAIQTHVKSTWSAFDEWYKSFHVRDRFWLCFWGKNYCLDLFWNRFVGGSGENEEEMREVFVKSERKHFNQTVEEWRSYVFNSGADALLIYLPLFCSLFFFKKIFFHFFRGLFLFIIT